MPITAVKAGPRTDHEKAAIVGSIKAAVTKIVNEKRDELVAASKTELSFGAIGAQLLPEFCKDDTEFARRVIVLAFREVLGEEKQQELAYRNWERGHAKGGGFRSKETRAEAARSQGTALWEDAEKDALLELAELMLYPANSPHRGKPDYARIATVLNENIHDGKNLRTPESVKKMYNLLIKQLFETALLSPITDPATP